MYFLIISMLLYLLIFKTRYSSLILLKETQETGSRASRCNCPADDGKSRKEANRHATKVQAIWQPTFR